MRSYLVLLILLLSVVDIKAQSTDEAKILQAIEVWKKALFDKNEEVLKEVLDDNLSYGHSNNKIESKTAFIDAVTSGRSLYNTMETPDMWISITGKTAIVRHRMLADIVDDGKAMNTNLGVMQVWVKKKSKWRLVGRQAFRL
jgi:ketosteroid isomerase-like protein